MSLPAPLQSALEDYLGEHCTSRCGNDIDCPHEVEFYAIHSRDEDGEEIDPVAVNELTEKN